MNNAHFLPKSALVPASYREDFSSGEVHAWASYPPCQDTAYDPFLYPGRIRESDLTPCLVAMRQPNWNVEELLGMVKLFYLVLDSSFSLRFRFQIKTAVPCGRMEVHFPTDGDGRLVWTLDAPETNRWVEVKLGWTDLLESNPSLAGCNRVNATALAVQAVVPAADPDMPIYFGLADVALDARRQARFAFETPESTFLDEWNVFVPRRHLHPGETLEIAGSFECPADRADMIASPLSAPDAPIFEGSMESDGRGRWRIAATPSGGFAPGLYRGCVTGRRGDEAVARSFFTFFVASEQTPGHPRLLFGAGEREAVRERFLSERFRPVRKRFETESREFREKVGIEARIYDFDQFPTRDWIASLWNWFTDRMILYREALFTNAAAYSLLDDREAGEFCRRFLLLLAEWPLWNHPWMEHRGFRTYFPAAEFAGAYALTYDLVHDLLSPEERAKVRGALMDRFVRPAFHTYVEWNQITSQSSNWISHIAGAALESLAALYGDDPSYGDLEPWLTGFLLKEHRFVSTAFVPDGAYGEGYRYYSFAMQSLARTVPAVERVFSVDLSGPVTGSWRETLWAGIIRRNIAFTHGDSERHLKKEAQAYWIGGQTGPFNSWAWLLERTRDPHLSWLYHHVREFETLQEVLHEVTDIPRREPDDLGNTAFFPTVGTAVFRSGWREDDFVFTFRAGPFFNHQHMDQGSFSVADHGTVFIEERYDGEHHYYDDPLYQSHTIQTISHNTVLIGRNPQSQKTGDPFGFAPGMDDHAVFAAHLDSRDFAFAAGELSGVYRGTVRRLKRSVLFLKPRTVLIVDEIVPSGESVEANLLFHTRAKGDIHPEEGRTRFGSGGPALFLYHLAPEKPVRDIVTDPHFLCQYRESNLVERGCLMVSADVPRKGLVFAHLLASTRDGSEPGVETFDHAGITGARVEVDGFVGVAQVNTLRGTQIIDDCETDARIGAATDNGVSFFISDATVCREADGFFFRAEEPVTACFTRESECRRVLIYTEKTVRTFWDIPCHFGYVRMNGGLVTNSQRTTRPKSQFPIELPSGASVIEFVRD